MNQNSNFSPAEERWMQRALTLAERGLYTCEPNPAVGCVIVKDGCIVGEGFHQRTGAPHAEIEAINSASEDLNGACAFVTLEPCVHQGRTGPCTVALIEAGIKEVVVASIDPNPLMAGKGIAALEAAGLICRSGLLEEAAVALNAGFIKRMHSGFPFVRLKIAASLDGATALKNGLSQWITDDVARQDVHTFRARSAAIITGIGTVLADNPRMTARAEGNVVIKQPLRVILDSKLRLPLDCLIASQGALVFTQVDDRVDDGGAVTIVKVPGDERGVDLRAVLANLGEQGINDVFVEAGPRLSGAFISQGLVDELILYQAPKLMGSEARGMADLGEIQSMQDVIDLELIDECRLGNCWRKRFRMVN